MKTYLVEMEREKPNFPNDREVMGYFHNLYDAKEYLRSTGYDEKFSVLMMQGYSFGEGFHKYRLTFSGVKNGKDIFKREKLGY